ncbi:hypothetical protein [Clostridium paraputrificum]|uniref:hypothetical protein n=1 Tax=Clostridium paraputrificum TaxID=29363 RepID=UPI0018A9F317|nr:hypothetical protein [Clostridium paraputrificum]MDB2101356.1 hypothetical protein [Clostridium paraputrificum]
MKKKIVTTLLALGIFVSIGSLFDGNEVDAAVSYGTKRSVSGNTSYAYGWTGYDGKNCKVDTILYDVHSEKTAYGWVQSDQLKVKRDSMAKSNHWADNTYIGYSQD